MKTRIISGIVMAVIVAGVLTAGLLWNPIVITVFVALLAAAALYELSFNAAGIKNKIAVAGECIYGFFTVLILGTDVNNDPSNRIFPAAVLAVCYFLFCVVTVLCDHNNFSLDKIAVFCGLPYPYALAFFTLNGIIRLDSGIYYLLLLLVFSSICDMGAYFTGVTLGKHKLCPEISPKKTVEGAVGGIVSSLVFAVVLMLCFKNTDKMTATLILTVPLCVIGMLGDLFASAIKRSVGLKDYSNLIPGHGGVLDRVDSILLVSPVLYTFAVLGVM